VEARAADGRVAASAPCVHVKRLVVPTDARSAPQTKNAMAASPGQRLQLCRNHHAHLRHPPQTGSTMAAALKA
jgi:hypothetical protein